jgi:hypothetical protein
VKAHALTSPRYYTAAPAGHPGQTRDGSRRFNPPRSPTLLRRSSPRNPGGCRRRP